MTHNKYLILESGDVFAGRSFGADAEAVGEVVFNTLMAGYLDTLTDARYCGQMVVQTFPLIGNYGVIPEETEGKKCYLSAYIAREICDEPSNFRCRGKLDAWLKAQGVVGISGVDTRRLTKILRDNGAMRAVITDSDKLTDDLRAAMESYRVADALEKTAVQPESIGDPGAKRHVVMVDFGARGEGAQLLCARGCRVTVLPYDATAKQILSYRPDAVVWTAGAGSPEDAGTQVAIVGEVLKHRVPVFAYGLGHQLLAMALGGKIVRLPYGHIGGQPVRDTQTGKLLITTQNHGYCVDADKLPEGAVLRYVNVNDRSCEGLDYPERKALSVQFMPTASGGPIATDFLFDRLIAYMEEK